MEGRSEVIKQIEFLKKLLHQDELREKTNTEEVGSVITDLTRSITSISHKPNSHAISSTIEIYVHACSDRSHVIRGAAAENLKKLIKKLMSTNFARIQQDLFHELKKDGEVRSICIVLECFGSLFPLTRPLRCSSYAQMLVPVFVQLLARNEEPVHDALQDALSNILPALAPFMTITNLKVVMNKCLEQLSSSPPSYRRMASVLFTEIGIYSKKSFNLIQWIISEFLERGSQNTATIDMVNSVLIVLQQFFSTNCSLDLLLLKQCFSFILSCIIYKEQNTVIAGLECLHHMLRASNTDFIHWLTSSVSGGQVVQNFWNIHEQRSSDSTCLENGKASAVSVPESENPQSDVKTSEKFCLAIEDGATIPLTSLFGYLQLSVLSSSRVSAQSLGLTCISCAVNLMPTLITSLDPLLPFCEAIDPKLRSSSAKLMATIIQSNLRICGGNPNKENGLIDNSFKHLFLLIDDETPIVLKSVCEALQFCLPSMVHSTMCGEVLNVLNKLLRLSDSTYWLTKVELLQTLRCLDLSVLSLQDQNLPGSIFNGVVLDLIKDCDHRVRSAACECLVSLAKTLSLDENLEMANAKKQSQELFSHLFFPKWDVGFNSITYKTPEITVLPPIGLDYILWFLQNGLSSSEKPFFQRGCLEALHMLSLHFPPTALPEEWGSLNKSCTLLKLLNQFLKSSKLAWSVQTHCYLLDICSSLFLSCVLFNLKKKTVAWGAIEGEELIQFASYILSHNIKLLSVFVHIIEGRDPEVQEKKLQVGPSPKKAGSEVTSPGRQKQSRPLQESMSTKPRLIPKDGMGYFANSPHFMKLFEACKAAYTNFEVSLGLPGTDQFSKLLITCHKSLASLLEVALANDIGKYVEEVLFYLGYTVRIDSSGALLCVQQLLNSLFGMNLGAQQTHIYSPFISSLNHNIGKIWHTEVNESLYDSLIMEPLSAMKKSLNVSSTISTRDYGDNQDMLREYAVPLKEALLVRPTNSVSDIKDYISFFEPLVVFALNQFPYTSSLLLQERVLFLVIQLLHLKVRYDLLDCNHSFFETVMKLTGIMESGMVRGGEALVPYLFQFLVLLSSDQSKLVTIPQVMQMCDGVMASGQNMTTFAIPALQPLVLYLFVRKTTSSQEVETQREVAMNMLLRLITNPRVILLLIHVLDYYKGKASRWNEVSNQIYKALLPTFRNLHIQLETMESIIALNQLFMAMDLEVYDFQEMLAELFKNKIIESSQSFLRWLSIVRVVLQLIGSKFTESTLFRSIAYIVPELRFSVLMDENGTILNSYKKCNNLAEFIMETLTISIRCLFKAYIMNYATDFTILPSLVIDILLLLQILFPGNFPKFHQGISKWTAYDCISKLFLQVSNFYPLLTLHYLNFLYNVNLTAAISVIEKIILPHEALPSSILQDAVVVSVCSYDEAFKQVLSLFMESYWNKSNVCSLLLKHIDEKMDIPISSCTNVLSLSTPTSSMLMYLQVFSHSSQFELLKSISVFTLSHPLSVVRTASEKLLLQYVNSRFKEMSSSLITDLIRLLSSIKKFSSEVLSALSHLSSVPFQHVEESCNMNLNSYPNEIDKDWYIRKIAEICSLHEPEDKCKRIYLLVSMEKEDLREIFSLANTSMHLLEECIAMGLKLTLNSRGVLEYPSTVPDFNSSAVNYMHPLLEIGIHELKSRIKQNRVEEGLVRCCAHLLAANHEFEDNFFCNEMLYALTDISLMAFVSSIEDDNPLHIQNSVDLCILLLGNSKVQQFISEEWSCKAIDSLCSMLFQRLKTFPKMITKTMPFSDFHETGIQLAKQKLLFLLNIFYKKEILPLCPCLHHMFEMLTFSLCRLPILHGLVITPPVLKKEDFVSDRVLDEALKESEVLLEYMQRCNSIGWLTRAQFEERWMQLLGVINQPLPPAEHASVDEFQAHSINVSAGLRAITSLLCWTMLFPHSGDPTTSVPVVHHRNPEIIFLGSRPGQKFMRIRKLLEQEILSAMGIRKNLNDYYQYPLSSFQTTCYPPLYARNIERDIETAAFGYGQFSIKTLWPIILKKKTSGFISSTDEVDVKSCILSLVDLYIHWFTQPINELLLKHVLSSIIILSDLFALSDQFEWMLVSLMDLYESHPQEDTSVHALLVIGVLKATAILKSSQSDSEGQIRLIEKALTCEVSIQNACLQGILYLSEDPNNNVIANCIPSLVKYIAKNFQDYLSYSEDHLKLVWSVAVVLIRDYHQYIKEQKFVESVLEKIIHLMNDSHLSSSLFHTFCFGLEFIILNFSVSVQEKASILRFSSNWFLKGEKNKSLSILAPLLLCMYTGDESSSIGSVEDASSLAVETAVLAREQVNNLMERLRHGSEIDTDILVDIIPQVITDFLSPMEVLQTVVTDFISPHQNRPEVSATILYETFVLLINDGHEAILNEWILLSLGSFVQQEPEARAIWSITCLFLASSTNVTIRAMFPLIVFSKHISEKDLLQILCISTRAFYMDQSDETKQLILLKFKESNYYSLKEVAQFCLM